MSLFDLKAHADALALYETFLNGDERPMDERQRALAARCVEAMAEQRRSYVELIASVSLTLISAMHRVRRGENDAAAADLQHAAEVMKASIAWVNGAKVDVPLVPRKLS